jgi:RHS repeat-associated protein
MTERTGPDGGAWGYGYSPDGLINRFTNPDISTVTHDLDNMDRMVRRVEPERTLDFILDGNSRVTSVTEHQGGTDHVTSYSYNANGLATEVIDRYGRRIDYDWNARGDITGLTTTDGLSAGYSYDAAGRVKRVTTGTTGTHWAEYSYDSAGRRSRIDYSNGTSAEYGYDTLGELTGLVIRDAANVIISSFDYSLDGNNQRVGITTHDGSASYDYDALYRLIREEVNTTGLGVFTNDYTYDAVGNRLDAGATFGPDGRLLTHGGMLYSHDNNGNLTGRGSESFGYDSSQRLTDFSDGTNSASYAYDYIGRRIERTVNGDTIIQYLYHDQDVLAEYNAAGTRLASYTYGPGMDQLLMMEQGGSTWFYHTDGLGSVIAITDVAGNLVQRYGYDAWGNVILSDGPFVFSGSGGPVNSRTFTGREYDAESGLYHFRARAYDPRLGRFLQKDSDQGIRMIPQSLHPYAYVLNNPVNSLDPTGRVALITYTFILTYPNGREVVAAAIGWLQGFGLTNMVFAGEVMALATIHPGDLGTIWAQATKNTEKVMKSALASLDTGKSVAGIGGVAAIPGAFAGGVSFELGIEIKLITGDTLGKSSIKAEGGGFENGYKAALRYIGSLGPR